MIFKCFPKRCRNDIVQMSLDERSLEMEGKQQTVIVSFFQSNRFNVSIFSYKMSCVV